MLTSWTRYDLEHKCPQARNVDFQYHYTQRVVVITTGWKGAELIWHNGTSKKRGQWQEQANTNRLLAAAFLTWIDNEVIGRQRCFLLLCSHTAFDDTNPKPNYFLIIPKENILFPWLFVSIISETLVDFVETWLSMGQRRPINYWTMCPWARFI